MAFASAASASAICSFCRSTLLRQDDALLRTGESAELFSDYSPLQIGTQGQWQGEPFTVLGRIQMADEGGAWNEWHALFERSGKSAWLSEDNGRFVLAWPRELAQAPAEADLVLGAQQLVDGQGWRVSSRTLATCHAAEGELPQAPRLGRAITVVELRNPSDEVGSLEFDGTAPPSWSVGRAVDLDALRLSHTRDESAADWGGRSLACPHCGAAVQPQLSQSQSIVCGQCQSVIELDPGAADALRHHQQALGAEPAIPLGRTGRLALEPGAERQPWQAVGFLERSTEDDGERFFWREYLLFNRQQGFAFLVDSSEGWSVVRVLTGSPQVIGDTARWQGQTFDLKERYRATTEHVLGEFYWRVQRREQHEVADYQRSDRLLTREANGQEITWSLGRRLDASEVQAAFALSGPAARRVSGDTRLTSAGDTVKGVLVFLLVAALMIGMIKACTREPCDSTRQTFGPQSPEFQQCLADQRRGSGLIGRGSGGSWGGGSGGGGHK